MQRESGTTNTCCRAEASKSALWYQVSGGVSAREACRQATWRDMCATDCVCVQPSPKLFWGSHARSQSHTRLSGCTHTHSQSHTSLATESACSRFALLPRIHDSPCTTACFCLLLPFSKCSLSRLPAAWVASFAGNTTPELSALQQV